MFTLEVHEVYLELVSIYLFTENISRSCAIYFYFLIEHPSPGSRCRPPAAPRSAAERANQTVVRGAAALQEDKHTHYSVSSTKQLQPKRPLDTLISERSLKKDEGRGGEGGFCFCLLSFPQKNQKRKKKNRHSERDSPSH